MKYILYNCKNKNLDLSYYGYNNKKIHNIFGSTMKILYNIDKYENEIQLFGKNFVINNKDNCYLIIEGQKYDICSKWKLDKNQKKKNILEIILIETKTITNMSVMFCGCNSLTNLPDISKWDTKNVTNMSYMFYKCSSLTNLPDISIWNTKNVTNMSFMFSECSSLTNLPDISKWDIKNVTNASYMFYNFKSLKNLELFSFNDAKTNNMEYMFYNCQ